MTAVVLVTGSSGGIGRALVEAFLEAGYAVVGVDLEPGPEARPGLTCLQHDLADPEAPRRIIEAIADRPGRLDCLVHNAAHQVAKPISETTLEDWETVQAVNLRAPYFLTREALPLLESSQGSIVHVASVHAVATSSEISAYAASKGGLDALTRALAIELAPRSIRVNAVLPGAVDTPMLQAGLRRSGLSQSRLERRTVCGRIGEPREIAEAVLFLADSQRAGFITGARLLVDGGATARLSTE